MANKQKHQKQTTNVTAATAKAAAEREKRLSEALRENLKRRKTITKKPTQ